MLLVGLFFVTLALMANVRYYKRINELRPKEIRLEGWKRK